MEDHQGESNALASPWIADSWRRCLAMGLNPQHSASFDLVSTAAKRRAEDANHALLAAARPTLELLGQAIAATRYFAILTDADGVVVDVNGPIDRGDPRVSTLARVGVDLSERAVGTTAISAALREQHPVWLHRGEHFFAGNSVYSCAGAPVFGPGGECVGMLDLTGVEAQERPELKFLVAQSARSIENTLALAVPSSLVVRLNWPGRQLGDESDGIVCLDADGWVTGANSAARQMVTVLGARDGQAAPPVHSSEVFAMPFEMLFDAAVADLYSPPSPMEVPLWSGLRLSAITLRVGRHPLPDALPRAVTSRERHSLRDVEAAIIRKAVAQAKGNVMQAARELGISRATVYRKLGSKHAP
jgi:transcriptional regulator of acetoin/glycerol metabolism